MRQTKDPVWQAAISIVLHERIQVDQHEYLNISGRINALYGRISVNIQWSGPEVTTVDVKSSRSKRSKFHVVFSSLYIKPVSYTNVTIFVFICFSFVLFFVCLFVCFFLFLSLSMSILKEQILEWNTIFYRPKGVT